MPMPSRSMLPAASTSPRRQASSPWLTAVGSRSSCIVGRAFGGRVSLGSTIRSPASERKLSKRDSVFSPLLASCSLRWPLSRTMKRLPSAMSMRPLRAVVTDSTLPREATMRTLRPLVVSLAAPSKKKVRWPSPELWNCPGATRERSERRSNTSFSSDGALVLPGPDEEGEHARSGAAPASSSAAPAGRSAAATRRSRTRSSSRSPGTCATASPPRRPNSDSASIVGRLPRAM